MKEITYESAIRAMYVSNLDSMSQDWIIEKLKRMQSIETAENVQALNDFAELLVDLHKPFCGCKDEVIINDNAPGKCGNCGKPFRH